MRIVDVVLPTSLSDVRNSRLAGLSSGKLKRPTAVRSLAPSDTATPLSKVTEYAPGLACSLAWSRMLEYTTPASTEDGETLIGSVTGMIGISPLAPAQPVPEICVRPKPRTPLARHS